MADDSSQSHAPPDLRQSALRDLAQARDNRALFIEAMANPLRRGIAFDVVERNCRERFAEGEDGIKLYRQLLGLVRLGNVSEAVEDFEHRFEPMLAQSFGKWPDAPPPP
jgi:hypothetical protein